MDNLLYYSPILIAVMVFLIQQRIVVTPEQLERKHREILKDVEEKFVTLHSFNDLKEQFSEMKEKIDKIEYNNAKYKVISQRKIKNKTSFFLEVDND